ncbi:MAG: hypothetical protein PHI18_04890 [bacterium]|nr:hypothetical protein [bacterium]
MPIASHSDEAKSGISNSCILNHVSLSKSSTLFSLLIVPVFLLPVKIMASERSDVADSSRINTARYDSIPRSYGANDGQVVWKSGKRKPRTSWLTSIETLWPRDRQEEDSWWWHTGADAVLYNINIAHCWRWQYGLEVQLGITLVDAAETYKEEFYFSPSSRSQAFGLSFGPTLYWTVIEWWRLGVIVDFVPQIMFSYREFPHGGTWINFFGRNSIGAACELSRKYSIEVTHRWGHVSNADVSNNPGWDGEGTYLGIRRQVNWRNDQ